jgi:hypothetical protein
VITRLYNLIDFKDLGGRSMLAVIDDRDFPETGYIPLLEVMLFSVGKYLGWDTATLKKYYATIPNVVSAETLDGETLNSLFGKDKRILVIKLIPDAIKFDEDELRSLMDTVRATLTNA